MKDKEYVVYSGTNDDMCALEVAVEGACNHEHSMSILKGKGKDIKKEKLFDAYWKKAISNRYSNLSEEDVEYILKQIVQDKELWKYINGAIDTLIDIFYKDMIYYDN